MSQEKINALQRRRRRYRNRNQIKRSNSRPRLTVFRSHKHIYAQIIDDEAARTLVSASTSQPDLKSQVAYGGNTGAARIVGKAIAERALAAGVREVAFDRGQFQYHGRVAALAEAAREAGLVF